MALSQMMKNYILKKEEYKDCVLFYRLGDFYEMFFEDAERVAPILGLALTARDCGDGERAPMCGIPAHAADTYIAKLVDRGEKVAICEQLSEPVPGKIVDRDVVRVVTPGTIMENTLLDEKQNNYIACVFASSPEKIGLSWIDISTGEFCVQEFNAQNAVELVSDTLVSISPSEVICNNASLLLSKDMPCIKVNAVPQFYKHIDSAFDKNHTIKLLLNQFKVASLSIVDLQDKLLATIAAGALIDYLLQTQKRDLSHINNVQVVSDGRYMHLDMNSRVNLELTESLAERKRYGSLLWVMDKTRTPMGARLLRNWLEHPLQNIDIINDRLNAVQELVDKNINRAELYESLKNVGDIERLCGRVSYGNLTPRNCAALGSTLDRLPYIKEALSKFDSKILAECSTKLDVLESIRDMLLSAFDDNPPNTIKDGGFIKSGFDARLDECLLAKTEGKKWMSELEAKEKELTGLKSLKISYNKIIGYFFDIPKSNADLLPFRFQRIQTLANSERFITVELKQLQETILSAEDKALNLELELFRKIREKLLEVMPVLQSTARQIAIVDVLLCYANLAVENNYCKPQINENVKHIRIKNGRHPIVEKLNKNELFVPNDTLLDEENKTLIITGPNMAGKSTYMRQVALITFMTHIGSFIPATEAEICLTDRIFTRIGASDNLGRGQSTFMVEMVEVANILRNATRNSLLILDEIGRGTSTYDGLSIAWAVIEYVVQKIGAKTLFATHYHELTSLEGKLNGVKNYKVLIKEYNNSIMFLRKIVAGYSDKSFGIEVAGLAGIPNEVIDRAKVILREHETKQNTNLVLPNTTGVNPNGEIDVFANIKSILDTIDINNLTPLEALAKLGEIKEIMKDK